jgi:hypothetical protein
MVKEGPECGRSASKRAGSGKKNAAALSAALRANLQRRKARERALRTIAQDAQTEPAAQSEPAGDAPQTGEATWTK